MRIMGIDAGFTAAGIAVVETGDGYGTVIHAECFQTGRLPKKKRGSVTDDDVRRIILVSDRIVKAARDHRVDCAVVELPHGGAQSAGAIKGMAFSTCLTATTLHCFGVPFTVISPFKNKAASGGYAHADKSEVLAAVKEAWPGVAWPAMKKSARPDLVKCEAIADALSCVLARLKGQV